jgi:hypothetical protein
MKLNHLFPVIAHHNGSLKERNYKYDVLRTLLNVRREINIDNNVVALVGSYDTIVQELSHSFPEEDVRRILGDLLSYQEVKDALRDYVGDDVEEDESEEVEEKEESDEEATDSEDESKTMSVSANQRAVQEMYETELQTDSILVRDVSMFTLLILNTFFSAAVFYKMFV